MSVNQHIYSKDGFYKPIGFYLIESGLISSNSIDQALKEQTETKERIGDILVRKGEIKQQTLDYIIEKIIVKDRKKSSRSEYKSKIHRLHLHSLNIAPQKVCKILLIIISALIILSFLEKSAIDWFNEIANTKLTTRFFGLDEEANFPTLYSTLTLGFSSLLLAIITAISHLKKSHYTKFWRLLSLIFVFLAVDESCSIHEIFIPIIRGLFNTKGFLYFPWVIPAGILLILFLIIFRDFIVNLPKKTRSLFFLAGLIYVSGALEMEFIGGYLADNVGLQTTPYQIAASIEEFLEMFGILIFIFGLLSYIESHYQEVNIPLSFQKNTKK